ncbi:MAG: (d)CMP kinase [Patescibacteria group bacterium]
MIISIAGTPGSGKTTVGKLLAERLGLKFYSIGALRGKMAVDKGIDLEALNEIGESEAYTDKIVDDYQKVLGEKEDQFVIEGRLSWYFIPNSFKVYLKCDIEEAARRVFKDRGNDREDEKKYASPKEVTQSFLNRAGSDTRRYKKYYGINYPDESKFDLVIDTTNYEKPEVAVEKIIDEIRRQKLIPAGSTVPRKL